MAYMESYEQLAFAIVKLAVEDYRSALKRLKRHSSDQQALWSKADCERFFRMILEHTVIWTEKRL